MVDKRVIIAAVVALVVAAFVFGNGRGARRAAPPPTTIGTIQATKPAAATTAATMTPASAETVPAPALTPTAPVTAAAVLRPFDLACPTTSPVDGGTGPASVPADCSRMVCTQMPPTSDDRGGISCVVEPPTTALGSAADSEAQRGTIGRLVPNSDDLGLFAIDAIGDGHAVRIDLDNGVVDDAPANFASGRAIVAVAGSGAAAYGLTLDDIEGVAVAPCSDGTYWSLGVDNTSAIRPDYSTPVLRRVRPHPVAAAGAAGAAGTAARAEVLQQIDVSTVVAAATASELLGTTSDDRPVLRGPSGQGYVVDPATGTFQRLTTGKLVGAQHGAFSEVVCNGSAQCQLVLHSDGRADVTITGETQLAVSFSPDGTHALLTPDARTGLGARMVDMTNGAATVVGGARGPITFTASATRSASVVWTPDGSAAMTIDGDRLLRIDTSSSAATSFALPSPLDGSWRLLAVD